MRRRGSPWVLPLVGFKIKICEQILTVLCKTHFFPSNPSGRQWSTLTTKSFVTWLKRNTKASFLFWCVKTGLKIVFLPSLQLKSNSDAAVCRMKSVWDQGRPVTSLSWRNWKTRWATIPTSSRKQQLMLDTIGSSAAGVQRLIPVGRLHLSYRHKLANGKTRRVLSREEFRLLHYAGEVNYNVNGKFPLHLHASWAQGTGSESVISVLTCYFHCLKSFVVFFLIGFLDKNNDLLNRNLKEVRW